MMANSIGGGGGGGQGGMGRRLGREGLRVRRNKKGANHSNVVGKVACKRVSSSEQQAEAAASSGGGGGRLQKQLISISHFVVTIRACSN